MKILQICSYYPTNKLYKNIFEEQEKLGIENYIYIPISNNLLKNKFFFKAIKSKLIYSKCFNKLDRFNFFLKQKKIWKDLNKKIDIKKIELTHAHTLFTNGNLALKIKKKYKKKYIVAVRNTDINVFFKYFFWLRPLGIKILKESEEIILISPSYKEKVLSYVPNKLKKEIEKKMKIIPNGMEDFWFENVPNIRKKKRKNLLFVGRLDKNKRVLEVIKSVISLNSEKEEFTLNIIGSGPLNSKIESYSKEKDYINYLGRITDLERLRMEYEKANILIMPSKTETFGIVYIEALSQECKVIYTEGEGISGFKLNNSYSLKKDEKMKMKIMESKNRAIFKNKEELKLFNWNNISSKYYDIYITIGERK